MILNKFVNIYSPYRDRKTIFITCNILKKRFVVKWNYLSSHYNLLHLGPIFNFCKSNFIYLIWNNYFYFITDSLDINTKKLQHCSCGYYNVPLSPLLFSKNYKMSNTIPSSLNMNRTNGNGKEVNENNTNVLLAKNNSDISKNYSKGLVNSGNTPFNSKQNNNRNNTYNNNNGNGNYMTYGNKQMGNSNVEKYGNTNNNYFNRDGNLKRETGTYREANVYKDTGIHYDACTQPADLRVNKRMNYMNPNISTYTNEGMRENIVNFSPNENRNVSYAVEERGKKEIPKIGNREHLFSKGDSTRVLLNERNSNNINNCIVNDAIEKNEMRNLNYIKNLGDMNNTIISGAVEGNVVNIGKNVEKTRNETERFQFINGNQQENAKYNKLNFNANKKDIGMMVANKNINTINNLRNNGMPKRNNAEHTGGNNTNRDLLNNVNYGSNDPKINVLINTDDVNKYGNASVLNRINAYQLNNSLYDKIGKGRVTNDQTYCNDSDRRTPDQKKNFNNNKNIINKNVHDFVDNGNGGFIGSRENERISYGDNVMAPFISYEDNNTEETISGDMIKLNAQEIRRRDFVQNATSPPKKIIYGINNNGRKMHTSALRGGEEKNELKETDKVAHVSSQHNSAIANNNNIINNNYNNNNNVNHNNTVNNRNVSPNTVSGRNENLNTSLDASLFLDCKEFEKYMYKDENILTLYYIRRNYMKAESKEDCKNENEKIKYTISWGFSNDEKVTAVGYHTNKKASKKACIEDLLKKLKTVSLLELEQMTKWMVNSLNVILKIESKNVETKYNAATCMFHSSVEWKVNNKLYKGEGISQYEKIAEMMGSQKLYMKLYDVKNELIKEAERTTVYTHYKASGGGHNSNTGYNNRQSRNKQFEENNIGANNIGFKSHMDARLCKNEGNNSLIANNPYFENRGLNEQYPGNHLKNAAYENIPPKPFGPPPVISSTNMYKNVSNGNTMGNISNASAPMPNFSISSAGSGQYTNTGFAIGPDGSGSISGSNSVTLSGDSRTNTSEFVSYNLSKQDCSFIQMLKHNIASKYKIIQSETIDVISNGFKCILNWEYKYGKNNIKISSVGFGNTKTLAKAEASYDMLIKNNLVEYISPADRKNAQYIKDLITVDLNKAVNLGIQFIQKYGSESWSIFLVNLFREIINTGNYDAATRLLGAAIESSKKGREEIDEMNILEAEKKMQAKMTASFDQIKTDASIGESSSVEQTLPHEKSNSYEQFYGHNQAKGGMFGIPLCYTENNVATGATGEFPNTGIFQNIFNSNVRKHANNQYVHRLVSIELWEKLIDECVVCLNSKLSYHCISLLQEMELDRSYFISTAAHNYYKKYRIMLALELQANINQSAQEKKDYEYLHDNKSLLLKIKSCTLPIISCTCLLTNEEKEWLKTTQMKEDDIVLLKPHDSDVKEDDVWANILMGSITSAKYDNIVYNVNIRLFSADNTKKSDFKYSKYKMYLLLNIVTHERMLQVLKAVTFIGAIPSQPASPYCFTPEIRFLLLHTYNKYSKHIAQKGRVNEEIVDYEKMKMDFYNNESIKKCADDVIADYSNASNNPYEDLLNEALNKQIDNSNIEEIDKFLIESVNLPTNLPLNETQKLACISAMTRRLTLVQGPPGTGKTHVACAIVDSWHRQNSKKKILAVADSNVAANNLVEGLKRRNIQAVRVGAATDVDFHEDAIKEFSRYKELLKLRKENKLKEAKVMKALLFQEAVKKYNVVIATCVGSGHEIFDDEKFERVIIDECAQSIEPSNLIPLGHYCNNLVLIGDHKQLPPTIISTDAAKMGLEVSLLERFITAKIAPVHVLTTQRRMHLSICAFPNMHFYNNRLKTANVTEENRPIIKGFVWPNPKCRVAFVDVSIGKAGSKFENSFGTSKFNLYEIEPLISVLKSVINEGCVSIDEIGILTAYDAQKIKLKTAIQKAFSHEAACRIEIDSIDGFQGKEKDLILFSAVRSNASNELGFLRDARRMNVMLTRAKRGVIIFGDQFTLANDSANWLPWLTWVASKRAILHLTKLNDHLENVDYSLFDKLNKINKSINFNNMQVSDNYYYYGNDTGFSNDYNNGAMTSTIPTELETSQVFGSMNHGHAEHIEEEIVENWEDLL